MKNVLRKNNLVRVKDLDVLASDIYLPRKSKTQVQNSNGETVWPLLKVEEARAIAHDAGISQ